jgi:hypothetical protein
MMAFEIVVLDRGFVYVGDVTVSEDKSELTITSCRNIRYWGTTEGLGQLAREGPTSSTKLDRTTTVRAPMRAVIHRLDTDETLWPRMK